MPLLAFVIICGMDGLLVRIFRDGENFVDLDTRASSDPVLGQLILL